LHVRLCLDAGGLDAATAQTAFAAATSLPGPRGLDAALVLAAIAAAHDLPDVAEVFDHRRERPDRPTLASSQAAQRAPTGDAGLSPGSGVAGRTPPLDAGVQRSVR